MFTTRHDVLSERTLSRTMFEERWIRKFVVEFSVRTVLQKELLRSRTAIKRGNLSMREQL